MSEPYPRAANELRKRCDTFFGSDKVWPEIEAAYSQGHRAYHNLRHLSELFEALQPHLASAPHAQAIELAVWFHDFVYKTDALAYPDNEFASAEAMPEVLARTAPAWLQEPQARELCLASELVLATKGHNDQSEDIQARAASVRACQLFLDADLSILGASPGRFAQYDDAIALEWGQDPGAPALAFCEGRANALQRFLERPRLFLTDEFASLETRARENLAELIYKWRSKAAQPSS